jgi:hypothetical protein
MSHLWEVGTMENQYIRDKCIFVGTPDELLDKLDI